MYAYEYTDSAGSRLLLSTVDTEKWCGAPTLQGRLQALLRGLPELRVAKACGLPQPTLNRLTNGRTQSPRIDALMKISTYFGVSIHWLLTGQTT